MRTSLAPVSLTEPEHGSVIHGRGPSRHDIRGFLRYWDAIAAALRWSPASLLVRPYDTAARSDLSVTSVKGRK